MCWEEEVELEPPPLVLLSASGHHARYFRYLTVGYNQNQPRSLISAHGKRRRKRAEGGLGRPNVEQMLPTAAKLLPSWRPCAQCPCRALRLTISLSRSLCLRARRRRWLHTTHIKVFYTHIHAYEWREAIMWKLFQAEALSHRRRRFLQQPVRNLLLSTQIYAITMPN